mgnify:CR=1 FL=1
MLGHLCRLGKQAPLETATALRLAARHRLDRSAVGAVFAMLTFSISFRHFFATPRNA